MSAKNQTQVLINGQIFVISGYESEEYIQKVAHYINSKLTEFQKLDSYRRQSNEKKSIIAHLNIADDYFKARRQVEILEEDIADRDKEIFDLKHELMDMRRKIDDLTKEELKKK